MTLFGINHSFGVWHFMQLYVLLLTVLYSQQVCGEKQNKTAEPKGCLVDNNNSVPLLITDKSGLKMVLCNAGLTYLEEALGDEELYITTVVGPARMGKSFLLNNLADISEEKPFGHPPFEVGHTPLAHTKGFWLSKSAKNVITTSSKRKVTAVFMDTEGSGATGNFKSYDPKICAVAAIISSNLLYNVMSVISMDDLDFLSKIVSLHRYLEKENASFPSPPITWSVQNWKFEVDKFDPPNEMGYLRSILQEKEISDDLDSDERKLFDDYNELIRAIVERFAPFDDSIPRAIPPIVRLDHPSRSTDDSKLTSLTFSEFNDTYQKQIVDIRKMIREGAKPKEFSKGNYMTGKSFTKNLKELVHAMNTVKHPGDAIILSIGQEALEVCVKEFKEESSNLPRPSKSQSRYNVELTQVEKKYLQKFDEGCLGDPENNINAGLKETLLERIKGEKRYLQLLNFNNQVGRCRRLASELIEAIKNVSSDDKEYNECGLGALTTVEQEIYDKNDHTDAIKGKLIQLERCHTSNAKTFTEVCSPRWCSSRKGNCMESLEGSYAEFQKRSEEALESQLKELSSAGFENLLFFLFIVCVVLFIIGKFAPKRIVPVTTVVYPSVFLLLIIPLLQSYKVFRSYFCDLINLVGFDQRTCMSQINELPIILGSAYNKVNLHVVVYAEATRNVVQLAIAASENRDSLFAYVNRWCVVIFNKIAALFGFMNEKESAWFPVDENDTSHVHSTAMQQLFLKGFIVFIVLFLTLLLRRRKII